MGLAAFGFLASASGLSCRVVVEAFTSNTENPVYGLGLDLGSIESLLG